MDKTHPYRWFLCHGRPRSLIVGFLLLTVVISAQVRSDDQRPRDPIQEFRDALKVDRDSRTADAIAFRETTLKQAAEKVQSLGDLAQVLLLQDWLPSDNDVLTLIGDRFEARLKADLNLDKSTPARQAAAAILIRDTVVKTRSNKGARSFPMTNRLAIVSQDLIRLIQAPQTSNDVRIAAVSALGEVEPVFYKPVADTTKELIRPDASVIENVMKQQLQSGDPEVRRAAGKALSEFAQGVMLFAEKHSTAAGTGEERRRSEQRKEAADVYRVQSLSGAVTAVASRLNDPSVEVRRACIVGLDAVASIAANTLVREPYPPEMFPPKGRPWSPEERGVIDYRQKEVDALRAQIAPLLEACQKAIPALAQAAVQDSSPDVRLSANHVLEFLALARQRISRLEESVPKEKKGVDTDTRFDVNLPQLPTVPSTLNAPRPLEPIPASRANVSLVGRPVAFRERDAEVPNDVIGASLHKALPTVEKGLADPDRAVRQATIDALEAMGDAAAPALPALVQSLNDPDKFVRWSASRVLGKLAPRTANVVIPKLAALTGTYDLDVRLAAASALERYGPAVKNLDAATQETVLRYLGNAVVRGDGDSRIAAMKVLQSMGVTAAPALPAVALNLTDHYSKTPAVSGEHPEAYVGVVDPNSDNHQVRQAASETLGLIGSLAIQAETNACKQKALRSHLVGVLMKAEYDLQSDVRLAASDALLKVTRK